MPEPSDRQLVSSALSALGEEITGINRANGWNVCSPDDWRNMYKVGTIIALIHSEASEALEACRKRDRENFKEELADILIRVLDCSHGMGIDIGEAVAKKLEANRKRGYRHGGKAC